MTIVAPTVFRRTAAPAIEALPIMGSMAHSWSEASDTKENQMNESARSEPIEQELLTVVDDSYSRRLGPWCAPVEFEDLG